MMEKNSSECLLKKLDEEIEGVHLYALNRLETVRHFSQLI